MRKKVIADNVIKLLKQGYSPKEITKRMAVSYNYAWKLKKDLEKAAGEAITEAKRIVGTMERKVPGGPATVIRATTEDRVERILDERGSNYGSFLGLSQVTQRLKAVAHNFAGQNNKTFDPDQAEALDMIFTKIGRILNGDPNHIDSWIDIAGYATLVADRLQGKAR
jgi:transposase